MVEREMFERQRALFLSLLLQPYTSMKWHRYGAKTNGIFGKRPILESEYMKEEEEHGLVS